MLLAGVALLAIVAMACSSDEETPEPASAAPTAAAPAAQPAPTAAPPSKPAALMQFPAKPAMGIDPKTPHYAIIELEKGGEIEIELFAENAPETVNNFVFLARAGFYDGVTFHRVIEGFMAQTGDPTGTGMGGPGYKFDNEFHPDLRHGSAGILSMANSGLRGGSGTNGSQFFITFRDTLFLDGLLPDGSAKDCSTNSCHSVFGKVVASSMDALNGITIRDPASANFLGDVMTTIRIEER
jgi:cyclophilin family peptidyl-prolyl cis-trans isomerase|tara:strand:- start:7403 stop:8122 length:720 start_codon:yes stop_codon:yes gene_type:complete